MTGTSEDDSTRRDDVGTARSVRVRRLRRTLTSALAGALLLGAAGAVVGLTRETTVGAAALVQSSPDPNAVEEAASGTTTGDPAARNATYLETELVYLQGDQLAAQVAATVGGPSPELEATRVGDSNVIQITSTAATAATAVAQTQAAADIYVQDRQQRLTTRIAEQFTALDAQIAASDAALNALPRPTTSGFDAQAQQRTALSTQYTDQLAARDALQRAAADVSSVAGVIQAATEQPGSAVSTVVLLALAGAVLGALLGAAAPALASSMSGRLRDEKDVADLGAPLLSPALPRATGSTRHSGQLERAVQLQALALSRGPSTGGSVAFVAGTTGVSTSFAALQHARHAARYRPTLLISAWGASGDELARLGVDGSRSDIAALAPAPGATVTTEALLAAAQPTTVPNLRVLVGGHGGEQELATMVRALTGGLVSAATAAGWGVVVDTGPLDRSDVGLLAARECAETVVIAGVRRSRTDELESTLRALRSAGVALSGVIVTHPARGERTGGVPSRRSAVPTAAAAGSPAAAGPAAAGGNPGAPVQQTGPADEVRPLDSPPAVPRPIHRPAGGGSTSLEQVPRG
jgi:hypothetical protein